MKQAPKYILFLPAWFFSLLLLALSACDGPNSKAIDFEAKKITLGLTAEPPNLNTLAATDQVSFFIIEHILEGLLAYDAKGNLAPAVAERWQLDKGGATFWLRKDALWSDGKKVTAHDFVFAWQTVVTPETASRYAFILAPLKNAELISAGKLPASALGVKALDDFTLQVTFERPCSYFLSLTTFATYFPAREDFYLKQGQRYFADVDNMIFNGPYTMTKWVHGAAIRLDKNDQYWNSKNIAINTLDMPNITSDPQVLFNLYRDGEIVSTGLDSETLKFALRERLPIKKFLVGAIFYLEFNHLQGSITANKNFRKALQAAFDPDDLVYKIIGLPGNYPAHSLFPRWLSGKDNSFQNDFPPLKVPVDIEAAKGYLALAREELGIEEFPPIILLSGDSAAATKQAEYLQRLFKLGLGLEIKIDKQIFKQRLEKMSQGKFDMVLAGWGPDYNDPLTFADLFYSKNPNNHGRYDNPSYDKLVEKAMNNIELATRMNAFSGMQDILIEDVVILPQYERGIVYVQNPKLKGVSRRIFGGDPSYKYAYIEE